MAAKIVVLLAVACAAQAQLFNKFAQRPTAVNPQDLLQIQIEDLEKVKSPLNEFVAQIHNVREKISTQVPQYFQSFVGKGQEAIEKAKNAVQNAAQTAAERHANITQALDCAKASRGDLEALLQHSQELLKEKAAELLEQVREEAGPLVEDIEARVPVVEQIVSETAEGVRNALAEGKLVQAAKIFKQGKDAIEAQLTAIVNDAKEIREDVAEDAEEIGREFYEETAAEAEAVVQKIKECISNGPASL